MLLFSQLLLFYMGTFQGPIAVSPVRDDKRAANLDLYRWDESLCVRCSESTLYKYKLTFLVNLYIRNGVQTTQL